MDIDPREFLDPDEEYEMVFAQEEEMLREMESDSFDSIISKKSLDFNAVPPSQNAIKSLITSIPTSSACFNNDPKSNQSVFGKNVPSTSRDTDNSFQSTSFYHKTKPSSSNGSSKNSEAKSIPVSSIDTSKKSKNKRMVVDLLEDINNFDIGVEPKGDRLSKKSRLDSDFLNDYDCVEPSSNFEVDKDLLMINKILKRRGLNQDPREFMPRYVAHAHPKADIILSSKVPKYAFISLRNQQHHKFYAKLLSDDALNNKISSVSKQCKQDRLLSIPFESVLLAANAIIDKKFSTLEKSHNINGIAADSGKVFETELWVEKYKPCAYLHLLSDEGTNRTLLKWLKLWDKIVFNRERVLKKNTNSNEPKFSKWKNQQLWSDELDDNGCPKHKIALLCGPPGLGKTTLAHVIAKHAGYNVVEMNASDDRSPDAFKVLLEAATKMKFVMGKKPKPNCLIIDEIDGAPSVSIEFLLKYAKGELIGKGKLKNKETTVLKRPIICICNDVYVPALRSLRQMAFVVHFPPTPQQRLAQRLIHVAEAEHIKTDVGAMLALCDKTNNDIRTCISTIYCLKDKAITRSTILNASIGSKDMQRGLFAVWQEIFHLQMKNINVATADIVSPLSQKFKSDAELLKMKRMVYILRTVQSNGDYDRLIQGVYENFLSVQTNNPTMTHISVALDWFCFVDRIKTFIDCNQAYNLLAYIPYVFVTWNFLFATYQRPSLKYPNSFYEVFVKQSKLHDIVQEVIKGMDVKIRSYCHREQLLLDILPFITYILNPACRQVSIQLFSECEKVALRQLVSTMIDYNLNFVQERTSEGSYEFNLDPNIDHVVDFPGIVKQKHMTYVLKQMIAREIEQERIKRLEKMLLKPRSTEEISTVPTLLETVPHYEELEIKYQKGQHVLNHMQKLTPKVIRNSPISTVSRDFFGRIIEEPSTGHQKKKVDEIVKSDVWFHFKEGYSNAVRRTVYIKDLL